MLVQGKVIMHQEEELASGTPPKIVSLGNQMIRTRKEQVQLTPYKFDTKSCS